MSKDIHEECAKAVHTDCEEVRKYERNANMVSVELDGKEYRILTIHDEGYVMHEVYESVWEDYEAGDPESGPRMEQVFTGMKLLGYGMGQYDASELKRDLEEKRNVS